MRDGRETRRKIERAALELFAVQGVAGTSIRDIAKRASVAEGALYRHHAGKDELVHALFAVNCEAMGRRLEDIHAAHPGFRPRIEAMVAEFCRRFDEDRELFSFLLLVQHGQLASLDPASPNPVEVLRRTAEEAMAAGEIPAGDPNLAAALVLGAVLQPATFIIYGRIDSPMGALAKTIAAAALGAVGAHS